MRKGVLAGICGISILLSACGDSRPELEGFYQSEMTNGYCVQITVEKDEKKFIEYIDNRIVQQGVYEMLTEGKYHFAGEVSEFDILLDKKNSFELQIPKINKDEGIRLKQIGKVPTYFDTEFDDTEEYIELLNE